jgi:hypothetical protein
MCRSNFAQHVFLELASGANVMIKMLIYLCITIFGWKHCRVLKNQCLAQNSSILSQHFFCQKYVHQSMFAYYTSETSKARYNVSYHHSIAIIVYEVQFGETLHLKKRPLDYPKRRKWFPGLATQIERSNFFVDLDSLGKTHYICILHMYVHR